MPMLQRPDAEIHYEVHGRRQLRPQHVRQRFRVLRHPRLRDDKPHPGPTSDEIAALAPHIVRVRTFLEKDTPG